MLVTEYVEQCQAKRYSFISHCFNIFDLLIVVLADTGDYYSIGCDVPVYEVHILEANGLIE